MIHRLQVTGPSLLDRLLDLALYALDDLLHLALLLDDEVGPIHAGNVGGVIQAQGGVLTQEPGDGQRMGIVRQQRGLALPDWRWE